jgi:hypothetical protein
MTEEDLKMEVSLLGFSLVRFFLLPSTMGLLCIPPGWLPFLRPLPWFPYPCWK